MERDTETSNSVRKAGVCSDDFVMDTLHCQVQVSHRQLNRRSGMRSRTQI